MNSIKEYFVSFYKGLKSLLIGMKVTLRIFFRKKTTECYPENRETLVIAERFRGTLTMPHDAEGNHKCIACGLCEMACPNGTIHVESVTEVNEETGKKKKVLTRYMYDHGSCMFCQMCVRACPHDAICFDNSFEHAVFTRGKLVKQLNKK
ncbi:MAG: 4Fe-4S binding protein [Bacteroidales bacterium]|jgi:NADH-quinone oxidoreductase subunit I|nr:4Fe-4S binding protein [Bacteroidales bacterium]